SQSIDEQSSIDKTMSNSLSTDNAFKNKYYIFGVLHKLSDRDIKGKS
ncbi:unnamed protein product, partial [Rotaria sp. Silwood2]